MVVVDDIVQRIGVYMTSSGFNLRSMYMTLYSEWEMYMTSYSKWANPICLKFKPEALPAFESFHQFVAKEKERNTCKFFD